MAEFWDAVGAIAGVVNVLVLPLALWIAYLAIREARTQRREARQAHEAQLAEQRRNAEEAGEAHRERLAEQQRALAAEVKLQRLAQLQRMADVLLAIRDAARAQDRDRLPALLAQLRVANAVLRAHGETVLSTLRILSEGEAAGMNSERLLSVAIDALGAAERCARSEENSDPAFE